jgi:hypothetical protein
MLFLAALPFNTSLVPTAFAGPRSGWRHVKVFAAEFMAVLAMRLGLADFIVFPKAGKVGANKRLFLENLLNRLSGTFAAVNNKRVHLQLHGPLSNRKGFALVGQKGAGSAVVGLLSFSGPAAVSRFVVAAIITAFNRIAVRCRAHIFEKIPEVIPPCADSDAARPVIGERLISRIITPRPHPSPDAVRSSAVHSMLVCHPHTMILA